MTQTVVVISIGPVQGFIAAARRMRDFAYGSRLLVELARLTAKEMQQQGSFSVIFPAQPDKDAPNKIVALYRGDITQLPAILHGIHAQLIAYLRKLMQDQITVLNNRAGKNLALSIESQQRAIAQIVDVLEFFWAFASNERYADALKKAENSLAARKSLRNVAAFPMGTNLPKSSLTGHYESVIPEEYYNLHGGNAKRFRFAYGVRNAERLSGIDLLKRHGSFPNLHTTFTSVALMAARGALQRAGVRTWNPQSETSGKWVTRQDFNDEWRSIDAELEYYEKSELRGDGSPFDQSEYAECLFDGRIAEFVDDPNYLKYVTSGLAELLKKHNISTDKPYYALLLADGDRMGKLISACTQVAQDASQHLAFSQALSEFADDVKKVVSRHDGEAIYTGGDDVLAIVPVPCAIACAEQIQHLFETKLSPVFNTVKSALDAETRNVGPSVSIGVAILHHMEPLSDAIEIVRSAEKAAKKSRSALAVTVSKRSGSDITVSGQWGSGFIERMKTLTNLLNSGDLPDGYAYEVRDLISRLHPDNAAHATHAVPADVTTLARILLLEEERILKRKKDAQGSKVNVGQIQEIRKSMYPKGNSNDPVGKTAFAHMTEWVNEIIVARELV
jgi:CRISPR-associated protein Cmr2